MQSGHAVLYCSGPTHAPMQIVTDISALGPPAAAAEGAGRVLVPTMGALHEGHAALIRHARRLADGEGGPAGGGVGVPRGQVVVSIFVNPTQFNDPSDLARYPRTPEADADLCRRAGADAVYAPTVESVYPAGTGAPDPRSERLPLVATRPGLEDAHRPGHFTGVYRVVGRLFDLVQPRAAVFGEKDWQQLQVVRALARAEGSRVEIVASPTVRDADGLALSSRNRFLAASERRAALSLSAALSLGGAAPDPSRAEAVMARVLAEAGAAMEYAVVREAESLLPLEGWGRAGGRPASARALIAARVGTVRLIDNAAWPAAGRLS